MIKNLLIKNFAIIDELLINFDSGLTVITGETGSGKSIIIEALSVAAGKKTDKMMIKSGSQNCVVDLDFNNSSYRRIINKSGRSKSYIDEAPITATALQKEFVTKIDFHGQHDQQLILKKENHIDYLDSYCKHQKKVDKIIEIYENLVKSKNKLNELKENLSIYKEKKELLNFQLNEIELADVNIKEEINLMNEYKKLNHHEDILSFINQSKLKISHHEGIISDLNNIIVKLEQLKKYDSSLSKLEHSIDSVIVQLQDVDLEMEDRLSNDEFDQERLTFIEQRISILESLKRKYGGSIESVVDYRESIRNELEEISSFVNSDKELKENIKKLEKAYGDIAIQLSSKREKISGILSSLIEDSLKELNMSGANFEIKISRKTASIGSINLTNESAQVFPKGIDQVEFFLSANPGEPLKPMASIASGGEMSRIMLAIKTVFQDQNPVSALIFDEIDTGISGQTAKKVSQHLKKLSKHKQVICITHLPQIAKQADRHLHISKHVKNAKTVVNAEYLEGANSKNVIDNLFIGEKMMA